MLLKLEIVYTTSSEFISFELRSLIDSYGNQVLDFKNIPTFETVFVPKSILQRRWQILLTNKNGLKVGDTVLIMIVELFAGEGHIKYGSLLI